MKYLASFLGGAVFGALVALLLAPSSGEELRSRLRTEVERDYQRAQDQLHKGMEQVQTQVDKLSSEVQAAASRSKGSDS
jgi:gas vesicle protein